MRGTRSVTAVTGVCIVPNPSLERSFAPFSHSLERVISKALGGASRIAHDN